MEKDENKKIKVLLIDDDKDEYIIARDIFSEIGSYYKITWIDSFDKGIEEVFKEDYEICLVDFHMGAHNGVEFIEKAALKNCEIPIILLTGQGDREVDLAAMKAGAMDYLDKRELNADTLERSIRYAIERKRSEEKIRFLAYYDQLTRLPNRTLFFDRLQTAIAAAKRYNRICAVMFLDIDNFKRVNDTLGHVIGDMLIKDVAVRLMKCIRKEDTVVRDRFNPVLDTVARLGGDEFMILLSEIKEPENASKVAERVRSILTTPIILDGKDINVSVSIGIAIYPSDGDNIENLIKNADIAMYSAKSRGKNNFQYYNHSMNIAAMNRLNLEYELWKALENGNFVLYYQPIIDLKTMKIKGAEALIRWQHPEKGMISPMDFIPVAEETGIITNIGEWVLRNVFEQFDKRKKNGIPEIDISVNISPKQLNQKDFLEIIKKLIKQFDVPAQFLTFEITESSVIHNIEEANKIINEIKDIGIKISLDDFGSGYSAFITLRQIPIDILKIDRSFIKDIPENPGNSIIAASFINIGHGLNLQVVGEGIEREDQLKFLSSKECDFGQGYYFNKPLPESELIKILK